MPAPSLPSRLLRPQFSLRALLVLMAAVGIGIGIAIFRWSWVETKHEKLILDHVQFGDLGATYYTITKNSVGRWESSRIRVLPDYVGAPTDDYRVTTTYRRGWNGKAARNGVQKHWQLTERGKPIAEKLIAERHYVDDELRRLVQFGADGEIVFSEDQEKGQPHGKYLERRSGDVEVGTHERGNRSGTWQTTYEVPGSDEGEQVTLLHSYSGGVLHGDWIWKTPSGRVLQSARFERGELVEWNELPPRQFLNHLLAQCNLSNEILEQLQQLSPKVNFGGPIIDGQLYSWNLRVEGRPRLSLFVRRDKSMLEHNFFYLPLEWTHASLAGIVEYSLTRDVTLMVREGKLFLVNISAAELDNKDSEKP